MEDAHAVQNPADEMTRTMNHLRAVEKCVGSSESSSLVNTSFFCPSTSRTSAWPRMRRDAPASPCFSIASPHSVSDGPTRAPVVGLSESDAETEPHLELIGRALEDERVRRVERQTTSNRVGGYRPDGPDGTDPSGPVERSGDVRPAASTSTGLTTLRFLCDAQRAQLPFLHIQ